jgi:acetoin utilization deacetylase AcuC-like enzyme
VAQTATAHSQRLVVDLDVHQGNGTAEIMQAHEWCYTFSMHGSKNYPYHKIPSRCDIGLADNTGDDEYLSTLMTALDFVMHAAHPDIVFYVSGADAYVGDRLGRLSLSKAGLLQRDQLVAAMCTAAWCAVCSHQWQGDTDTMLWIQLQYTLRRCIHLWN